MKEKFLQHYVRYIMSKLDDGYVDMETNIEGFKKECLESAKGIYDFLDKNYSYIYSNDLKPCSDLSEFVSVYFNNNMDELIEYLLNDQDGYTISTTEAFDFTPRILDKTLGFNLAIEIGYRHAYITTFPSPIDPTNRVVEWAIGIKRERELQKRITTRFQTEVPGIVVLGLIAADNQLKATGNYTLKYYIPWENDCHTYVLHVQEKMNKILPAEFRQTVITLPCHVAPNAPLEEEDKEVESDLKRIRQDRDMDTPPKTQLSRLFQFFKGDKPEVSHVDDLNTPLI